MAGFKNIKLKFETYEHGFLKKFQGPMPIKPDASLSSKKTTEGIWGNIRRPFLPPICGD